MLVPLDSQQRDLPGGFGRPISSIMRARLLVESKVLPQGKDLTLSQEHWHCRGLPVGDAGIEMGVFSWLLLEARGGVLSREHGPAACLCL